MPNIRLRLLLGHLVWAILTVLFWNTLYKNHLPESFNLTYLIFVLFIYSIRGLLKSFITRLNQETTD